MKEDRLSGIPDYYLAVEWDASGRNSASSAIE